MVKHDIHNIAITRDEIEQLENVIMCVSIFFVFLIILSGSILITTFKSFWLTPIVVILAFLLINASMDIIIYEHCDISVLWDWKNKSVFWPIGLVCGGWVTILLMIIIYRISYTLVYLNNITIGSYIDRKKSK